MPLPRLHRIAGLVALGLFISTGIYMRVKFPGLYENRESVRDLFRANHIYIVMSSMVNIALSLGLRRASTPIRARIQLLASTLILIAPLILFAAFFKDPPNPDSDRTLSRLGVIFTVAGVLLHLFASPPSRIKPPDT